MLSVDYTDEKDCLRVWQIELAEQVGRMKSVQQFLGGTLEADLINATKGVEDVIRAMRTREENL